MAYKATDGQPFTNRMAMKMHDASLRGMEKAPTAPPAKVSKPGAEDQPPSITDNPQAMRMVDQLQQMGYTADDVAEAMGGETDQQQGMTSGQEATAAAPMQIPGTR